MKDFLVLTCLWGRAGRAGEIAESLRCQGFGGFDACFINNRPDMGAEVESACRGFGVIHSGYNAGPIARFIQARACRHPFVIFIDDDMILHETSIGLLAEAAERNSLKAVIGADFKRCFEARKKVYSGRAKYLGPGGMVADASIFRDSRFWDGWKPQWHVADDIWLSFQAEKAGWKKEVVQAKTRMLPATTESMLRQGIIQDIKQEVVDALGWWEIDDCNSIYVMCRKGRNGNTFSVITEKEYNSLPDEYIKSLYTKHPRPFLVKPFTVFDNSLMKQED